MLKEMCLPKKKVFADQLLKPVTNVITSSLKQGIWPDIYIYYKVSALFTKFPPQNRSTNQLVISDMKSKMDPSQYANQKGLSINYYLIKFVD